MDKKEKVEKLYQRFREYTETAEQHEFTTLLLQDMMISRGYDDLQRNWNDEHADVFIRGVCALLKNYGVNVKEIEEN